MLHEQAELGGDVVQDPTLSSPGLYVGEFNSLMIHAIAASDCDFAFPHGFPGLMGL